MNRTTEIIRKIESTLLVLQDSAEHGNMDSTVYADVLGVIIEELDQLSTLLSQKERAAA